MLSTGSSSTASDIVFQGNKEICVLLVHSDEHVACTGTIRPIGPIASAIQQSQTPSIISSTWDLLSAPCAIFAVLSIAVSRRVSAIPSLPTRLSILPSATRATITTFRIQLQLFISGDLQQLTSVGPLASDLSDSRLFAGIRQSNADI
jgi:hypothetical protein